MTSGEGREAHRAGAQTIYEKLANKRPSGGWPPTPGSARREGRRSSARDRTIGGPSGALERILAYTQLGIEHIALAHSITLGIATLGFASAPELPLNAVIALSILFLGPEIVRVWRGQTSFTIRHPWVVAFVFGLLHGFAFASGLTAMGLPQNEIPLALLFFNVGVDLGQIAFVCLVLWLARSFRALEIRWPRWVESAPATRLARWAHIGSSSAPRWSWG